MKPKVSLLSCKNNFITDLSVRANSDHDPDGEIYLDYDQLEIKTHVSCDDNLWKLILRIEQNAALMKNSPYSFSIELFGFFSADNVDEAQRELFVRVNGLSLLFGMARDALKASMSRGPFVPILLPLVSFYDDEANVDDK